MSADRSEIDRQKALLRATAEARRKVAERARRTEEARRIAAQELAQETPPSQSTAPTFYELTGCRTLGELQAKMEGR